MSQGALYDITLNCTECFIGFFNCYNSNSPLKLKMSLHVHRYYSSSTKKATCKIQFCTCTVYSVKTLCLLIVSWVCDWIYSNSPLKLKMSLHVHRYYSSSTKKATCKIQFCTCTVYSVKTLCLLIVSWVCDCIQLTRNLGQFTDHSVFYLPHTDLGISYYQPYPHPLRIC